MIRVDIDSLILHRAEQIKRAENILQPGAQDRSFTKKGSRAVWCGAIGQAVFERLLEEEGIPFQVNSVITHDYQVPAGRLEVKTKERSVVPQPYPHRLLLVTPQLKLKSFMKTQAFQPLLKCLLLAVQTQVTQSQQNC